MSIKTRLIDGSGTEQEVKIHPAGDDGHNSICAHVTDGKSEIKADLRTDYYPAPTELSSGTFRTVKVDSGYNLMTRGPAFSDEGSFRNYYTNPTLYTILSGTCQFVKGSDKVTGEGTAFLSEIAVNDYIVAGNVDGPENYTMVLEVVSDTELILSEPYLGSTINDTASKSSYRYSNSGTASDVSISSNTLLISSGTANAGYAQLWKEIDYMPMVHTVRMSISQRIANQTITVGLQADEANTGSYVHMIFSGTSANSFTFRSGNNATLYEDQTITLERGAVTSDEIDYEINILPQKVILLINKKVEATFYSHVPGPYEVLGFFAKIENANVVTATDVNFYSHYCGNLSTTALSSSIDGDQIKVEVLDNVNGSTKYYGLSDGNITTASTSKVAVRKTAYTEQTTNAQRSFASSSSSDAAAGTGVRTLQLTYLDQNGVGPYTETITLNGTTGVNTVATNICYVESIDVLTVGSTGAAVGTITMYSAASKGGVTITTIAIGDTKTYFCHHYVPSGSTCYITSFQGVTTGTVSGNGALFVISKQSIPAANNVVQEVSDIISIPGSVIPFVRNYDSPITPIAGPCRITGLVTPKTTTSITSYMAMSYYEV